MFEEEIIFDTPLKHKDGNTWCHLVSKDIEKLKKFAFSIGLKPEWIQTSSQGVVHFDIKSDRIRELALKKGAKQVDRKYLYFYLKHHNLFKKEKSII